MALGQLVVLGARAADRGRMPALYVRPHWFGPVAMPALRVGMGAFVGLIFGLACGNMAFWLALGAGLGGVFQALLPLAPGAVSTVFYLPAPRWARDLPAYQDRSRPLSIREAA